MKSLNKREKILILVMLLFGIIYGYMKLFLNPVIDEFRKVNSNISSYKNQLNNINNTNISNKKLESQLSDLQEKLNDAMKVLPLSERSPEVVYNIKQFADRDNVILNDVTIEKTANYSSSVPSSGSGTANQTSGGTNNNNLMYLPVTVSVSGEYSSIIKFISSIEQGNRIAEVSSIDFIGAGKTLQANINTNFYYIMSSTQDNYNYDFNKGSYGKDNIFN